MKRDLWDAQHKCTDCTLLMKRKRTTVDGTKIRAWQCVKCEQTVLHPDDAQRMLLLSKLKRGLSVKLGELGRSLVVRIPKDFAKLYGLSKGEHITLKAAGENKIEFEIPA